VEPAVVVWLSTVPEAEESALLLPDDLPPPQADVLTRIKSARVKVSIFFISDLLNDGLSPRNDRIPLIDMI
jgi:hypothetical protein